MEIFYDSIGGGNRCDRCRQTSYGLSMSIFNTEMICDECEEKEERHSDYRRAKEAEDAAVRRGDYNFPGIGKPSDL